MGDYRDSFNGRSTGLNSSDGRSTGSNFPRQYMQTALWELLVCLFLTGEQIDKLKGIISPDVDDEIALEYISEMCVDDVQGIRKYILSEICDKENLLMIAVYMVQVNVVAYTDWRRISYGKCLTLLKFVKTEKVGVEHQQQIEAGREPWQTFLGTLKDKDGHSLEKCTLCENNIRDVIFMPCGHFGACRVCADKWKLKSNLCPYCRTPIESIDSVREHLDVSQNGQTTIPFGQHARCPKHDIFSLLTQLRHAAVCV